MATIGDVASACASVAAAGRLAEARLARLLSESARLLTGLSGLSVSRRLLARLSGLARLTVAALRRLAIAGLLTVALLTGASAPWLGEPGRRSALP